MATTLDQALNPDIFGMQPRLPAAPQQPAAPQGPGAEMEALAAAKRPRQQALQQRITGAETEQAKLGQEAAAFQQQQAAKEATGTREAYEQERKTVEQAPLRSELEQKVKQEKDYFFQPSQRDGMAMATLASLMTVLGTTIGKGGKANATAALAGLNGMMDGYRKGSDAVYRQEKAAFESNAKALKDQITTIRQALEQYEKKAATDRQGAILQLRETLMKEGADFVASRAERQGVVNLLPELRKQEKQLETEIAGYERKAGEAKENARRDAERAKEAAERERMRIEGKRDLATLVTALKERKVQEQGGPQQLVQQFTGATLPLKQAQPVVDAAAAIGESKELQDIVRKSPGIVGREGQVRQYIDRYVRSAFTGEAPPKDSDITDQDALLFAKRYASYLVNYERSLAPGARGFTVFFQRRFNDLMKQDQFNAAGMIALLEDQQREIATQVTRIDKRINRDNLSKMGDDIVGRSSAAPAAAPTGMTMPSADAIEAELKRRGLK